MPNLEILTILYLIKKFKRENIEYISKLTNFIQSKENINKFSLKKKSVKKSNIIMI